MVRHKLEKPTGKSIDDALSYLQDAWSDTHEQWRKYDSYYHRTFTLWPTDKLNENRPSFHPSTPTSIIDHAADSFMAFAPTIKRYPSGKKAPDSVDVIEASLQQVMLDSFGKELTLPPKDTGRNLLHYGYAIARGATLAMHTQPEEPERNDGEDKDDFAIREAVFKAGRRNWNPIRYSAPHPATVLLDPLEAEPTFAIEKKLFLAKNLHQLTVVKKRNRIKADIFDISEMHSYERVKVLEYWDAEWHVVKLVGGRILYEEWNPFGRPPFSHGYAGFGQPPMPDENSDINPKYLAVGLLESVMESIKMEAQRMTAHQNLLMRAAYAIYLTTLDPAEMANIMSQDGIAQVTDDIRDAMGIMPTPEVTAWMLEVGSEIGRDIESGTFVKALAGVREQGVSTVGQQVLLSTAAMQKFAAPAIRNQIIWTSQARATLRAVMTLDETMGEGWIQVNGQRLSAEDINFNDNVTLTFENLDPVLLQQAKITGMQEVAQGLKSPQDYREFDARMSNEAQSRDRLLEHQVLSDPFMIEVLAQEKAEEMGLERQFAKATQLRKLAEGDGRMNPRRETGQPSANGAPQGGNNDLGSLFPDEVPNG